MLVQKQLLIVIGREDNKSSFAYDTTSDTWRQVASLYEERYRTAATLWNGKVVVAGGYISTNKYLKSVEQYEPESNSWTALPHMLHSRLRLALVCFGNMLFAIGGLDDTEQALDSVERYNVDTKQWQRVASLNVRRGYLCGAALQVCQLSIEYSVLNVYRYAFCEKLQTLWFFFVFPLY